MVLTEAARRKSQGWPILATGHQVGALQSSLRQLQARTWQPASPLWLLTSARLKECLTGHDSKQVEGVQHQHALEGVACAAIRMRS